MPRCYRRDPQRFYAALTLAGVFDPLARFTFLAINDVAAGEGGAMAENGMVTVLGAPLTARFLIGLTGAPTLRQQKSAVAELANKGLTLVAHDAIGLTPEGVCFGSLAATTAASRMRALRERSRNGAVTLRVTLREQQNEPRPPSPSPPTPPTPTPPHTHSLTRARRAVSEHDFPRFGDLEPLVVAYIANAAAENKSGKISDGRELTLRSELQKLAEKLGDSDAFAAGLLAANKAEAPNVHYVAKAAKGAARRTADEADLFTGPSEPERRLPTRAEIEGRA